LSSSARNRWALLLVIALALSLITVPGAVAQDHSEELDFGVVPHIVRPGETPPTFELRNSPDWSVPFEEPASVRVEYFREDDDDPEGGGEFVELETGHLEIHSETRASFEVLESLPEASETYGVYYVYVTSGDHEGQGSFRSQDPDTDWTLYLESPDDVDAADTVIPLFTDVAWLTEDVADLELTVAGSPVDPGAVDLDVADAANAELQLAEGTLQAGSWAQLTFTTADGVSAFSSFHVAWEGVRLTPHTLMVGHEVPMTLTFELTGGLTLPAEPEVSILDDWEEPVDALGDLERISDTELTAELVTSLDRGYYEVAVTTSDGVVSTSLDVTVPRMSVGSPLVTTSGPPYSVWIDVYGHDLGESVSASLVAREGGSSVPVAIDDYYTDGYVTEYYEGSIDTELSPGLYDLHLTAGDDSVSAPLRVRDPHLQLWYDHWSGEGEVRAYGMGFDLAPDTVGLYDRDGDAIPLSEWWLDDEYSDELWAVPEEPLDDETYTLEVIQGEATYRGKFHAGSARLQVDPSRLDPGYEDTTLDLHAPGGDLGPLLSSHERWWSPALPAEFGAVERVARDHLRQPVAAGLDDDWYQLRVDDGDVWWHGNVQVGEEYRDAWVGGWLEPGFEAPRNVDVDGYNTHWEDGLTTVAVFDEEGEEIATAVGDVSVHHPEWLTFSLLVSLEQGSYEVEIRTGEVVDRATMTVDYRPRASVDPSMLRPADLPSDVTLTVQLLDLEDASAEIEIYDPSWQQVTWDVTVDASDTATISVPEAAAQGEYWIEVDTDDGFAWTTLTIADPRATISPARLVVDEAAGTTTEGMTIDVEVSGLDLTTSTQYRVRDRADDEVVEQGAVAKRDGWWRRGSVTLATALDVGDYRLEVVEGGTVARAALAVRPPRAPGDEELVTVEGSGSTTVDEETGEVTQRMGAFEVEDLVVTRTATCADGDPDAVTLQYADQAYPMEAIGDDRYQAVVPADDIRASWGGQLVVVTDCGGDTAEEPVGRIELFDPAGDITDAVTGEPVVDAAVTLYYVPDWTPQVSQEDVGEPRTCQSNVTKPGPAGWDQPAPVEDGLEEPVGSGRMDPDVNPQYTDAGGRYAWDVAEGCWYVTVAKDGYEALVSPVVGVGPEPVGEVTDLDLELTPVGTGPDPDPDPDPAPPAWPSGAGIAVDQLGPTQFTASWPQATSEDGEAVRYLVRLDEADPVLQAATSRTFSSLAPGVSYTVEVRPVDADGNVGSVITKVVTTPEPDVPPEPAPSLPSCTDATGVTFPDVDTGSAHAERIGCAAGLGLVEGFADGTFGPGQTMTRAQLASVLARSLRASGVELPDGPEIFEDVTGGPHAQNIHDLAAAGVIKGRSESAFDPGAPVQRAQVISMLVRASDVYPPAFPASGNTLPFTDIAGSTHAENIARAERAGIAEGREDGTFAPSASVRRDQAASFLTRWLDWRAGQA
jgi:hypothetical protein